jgi:ATP-dependent Lon protease
MTGEITLRGKILPVGGIREKVLSAHRSGLKTVLLPRKNEKDLIDVPKRARSELKIILVDHIDQVLKEALLPPRPVSERRRAPRKKKKEAEIKAEPDAQA